jgi:hypothetical protein
VQAVVSFTHEFQEESPSSCFENYAKEVRRDQEEARQKDRRKLCYMRDVTLRSQLPRKDRWSTAGYVLGDLVAMSGDCA